MKKTLIIIVLIACVILVGFYFKVKEFNVEKKEIEQYNASYEVYNKENLNGLDITTVMNKATSDNEKNSIAKDNNGLYVLDDEKSIEIYVTMIINETTYRMESFTNLETNDFVRLFGDVSFKCTDVTYHEKNGRIATMTFEATEY